MATIRSSFSILVFALLLCSVFPLEQIRWSFDIKCSSSIGNTGGEQTCDFSDAGAVAESEGDSPQEMQDDYFASGVSVSDCGSSRSDASMNEIPQSTLLASQLFHPPTARS